MTVKIKPPKRYLRRKINRVNLLIRIPIDLKLKIDKICPELKTSKSYLVEAALKQYIDTVISDVRLTK